VLKAPTATDFDPRDPRNWRRMSWIQKAWLVGEALTMGALTLIGLAAVLWPVTLLIGLAIVFAQWQ